MRSTLGIADLEVEGQIPPLCHETRLTDESSNQKPERLSLTQMRASERGTGKVKLRN
jgi:hypothetical protein